MTEMKDRSDSQLLNAFAEARDEATFAEMVRRHGPLVWRVCYRVLGRTTDVEDAAQATLLALAKQFDDGGELLVLLERGREERDLC